MSNRVPAARPLRGSVKTPKLPDTPPAAVRIGKALPNAMLPVLLTVTVPPDSVAVPPTWIRLAPPAPAAAW